MDKELIPIIDVLDDMHSDKGPITWAARSYYYIHYATEEERIRMDKEDKINFAVSTIFISMLALSLVFCVLNSIFGWV